MRRSPSLASSFSEEIFSGERAPFLSPLALLGCVALPTFSSSRGHTPICTNCFWPRHFCFGMPIYKMSMEEVRWEAVFSRYRSVKFHPSVHIPILRCKIGHHPELCVKKRLCWLVG